MMVRHYLDKDHVMLHHKHDGKDTHSEVPCLDREACHLALTQPAGATDAVPPSEDSDLVSYSH